MPVYKVVELIGTSPTSWEEAAQTAVSTASESLRHLRIAEVIELDMSLSEDGTVKEYRAKVRVSFRHESGD